MNIILLTANQSQDIFFIIFCVLVSIAIILYAIFYQKKMKAKIRLRRDELRNRINANKDDESIIVEIKKLYCNDEVHYKMLADYYYKEDIDFYKKAFSNTSLKSVDAKTTTGETIPIQSSIMRPGNIVCPYCKNTVYPYINKKISTGGIILIVAGIVLAPILIGIILIIVGVNTKEISRHCPNCKISLGC